jgi:predicted ribosome quality control (RQC) complex YloA/Tae2 family protein
VVLLDANQKLKWALHRPLHSLLTRLPPAESFPAAAAAPGEEKDLADRWRAAATDHLTVQLETEWTSRLSRALRHARKGAQRLVQNLQNDLAGANRGDEYRLIAETMAIHLHELPRGAKEIELPSPHGDRQLRFLLNPALSPAANMEIYFRLARKADRSHEIIAARLAAARTNLAELAARECELDLIASQSTGRLEALLAWQDKYAAALGLKTVTSGRKPAVDRDLERPFRRYRIERQWDVWVGRNNRENDILTHHHAASDDLWFHAQSVSGSHVILRTQGTPEQVPKRVLAKAAALAALHSKARHSTLVPVVYTRRKYVRKPRKTTPGTATYVREKSLMVKPQVAPGVEVIQSE